MARACTAQNVVQACYKYMLVFFFFFFLSFVANDEHWNYRLKAEAAPKVVPVNVDKPLTT